MLVAKLSMFAGLLAFLRLVTFPEEIVTGKLHFLVQCSNPMIGLRPATLLKKRLWYRYFPVNLAKFLRIPFLQNTSERLLLNKQF